MTVEVRISKLMVHQVVRNGCGEGRQGGVQYYRAEKQRDLLGSRHEKCTTQYAAEPPAESKVVLFR